MGVKGKICVVLVLFVGVVLVSASVSFGLSDREPEKQRREREGDRGGRGRGGGGGEYDIVFAEEEQEVKKMVEDCHQSCQGSQGEQQRPQCFQTCMQKRFQERGRSQRGDTGRQDRSQRGDTSWQDRSQQGDSSWPDKSRRGDSSQPDRSQRGDTSRPERTKRTDKQRKLNNPYVFEDHHFTARLESEHGNVRVLQKFTDRSDLFQGIEKYRVVFLEAEPQTFIIPNHWDADALVFVANGQGTITLIDGHDSRTSHNIKRGDLFLVPAGISAYLINGDNNERLVLAKILRSVSVPGELQIFSVGAGNPESSFFNAFSTEVLEAAFDVDRDSIGKMIGQQELEQGIFKKATEEQIKSLTGKDKGTIWPFSEGKEHGTHNIYKDEPSVANENGNLHEVDSKRFKELRDINVAFSFFNITQGSMAGPFYNTKTTLVLMVPNGEGRFEMACPHLSEQVRRSGEINPSYEKVSSELRRGTVVVIPAGHPVVIEASGAQNLEVIGFGLNSDQNEWFPLAGRDNVISQWEEEAIELTFGFPAKVVQQVIEKQSKKLFFKGPVRSGRAFA